MKKISRPLKYLFLMIMASAVIIKLLVYFFVINTTGSLPNGLYVKVNKKPEVGDVVLFCPPDNQIIKEGYTRRYITVGSCPSGYGYMLKKILTDKTNDEIIISEYGIYLNGSLVENTKPLEQDSLNRPLPVLSESYVLNSDELFLYSDFNPKSFDGRYFGPVKKEEIIKVVRPLYITK